MCVVVVVFFLFISSRLLFFLFFLRGCGEGGVTVTEKWCPGTSVVAVLIHVQVDGTMSLGLAVRAAYLGSVQQFRLITSYQ